VSAAESSSAECIAEVARVKFATVRCYLFVVDDSTLSMVAALDRSRHRICEIV